MRTDELNVDFIHLTSLKLSYTMPMYGSPIRFNIILDPYLLRHGIRFQVC